MRDSLALHGGRRHFFYSSSFIAAMSSICSVKSRFSFAFSSSSAFSRLASDTVIPEYFAFQGHNVEFCAEMDTVENYRARYGDKKGSERV